MVVLYRYANLRVVLIGAMLAFALITGVKPGLAQGVTAANAALEARRDALFQATLVDPTNLDVAFEYAQLSAELGDYEGAIATLERMLIYAPNLPRLQLELGVLYYRIGAIDMARTYLQAAKRPDTPPQVLERVDTFLAQLDRQDQRFSVSGSFHGGVRVQSNANAAPDEDIISVNGIPLRLDQDARAQADGNIFSLADINIAYDLRNQNDFIEANIVSYNSVFFDISRLNLNLLEAQIGPNFGFGRFGFSGTRLGVYGIGGVTSLGQDLYSTQYGAGARVQSTILDWLFYDARYEFRSVNYNNSKSYPTVRIQTGEELSASNQVTVAANARLLLQAAAHSRIVFARRNFKRFGEIGAWARGTYYFYLPEFGPVAADAPWSMSLAGGGLLRRYADPDPLINAFEAEEDDLLWIEAGVSAPLRNGFSAFATGQLRYQESNYPTREFFNAVLTVGLSRAF
ncbi:MAG: tetratricopeptide repeat protein [Pseudomonadota bacterium]